MQRFECMRHFPPSDIFLFGQSGAVGKQSFGNMYFGCWHLNAALRDKHEISMTTILPLAQPATDSAPVQPEREQKQDNLLSISRVKSIFIPPPPVQFRRRRPQDGVLVDKTTASAPKAKQVSPRTMKAIRSNFYNEFMVKDFCPVVDDDNSAEDLWASVDAKFLQ
jgi:hypothetical protein